MQVSWNSISAGAMTAAVSLTSAVQSMGASATAAAQAALPAVTAGGMQASSAAVAAAQGAANTLPQALPNAVNAGAASTAKLASDLALVEKPAKAMAAGIPRSSLLMRTAGFLGKALPIVTIGASTLSGARIVQQDGVAALVTSKDGRGAVLGALGGALLLVPSPATQLAAAGVLGAVAVNQFGGMDRLDRLHLSTARATPASPSAG